ncbi:V-type ATP synthase subunit D [Dactylosporangium sp. CA-139066]|uniref:V-type ATP synthase subunit D n=1 Tax=Dactylosporangium sp. CA-139066 TaxID=3239930 RepID=UPI003D94C52A
MNALRHVPVGRSGLLWLRHRLEVTRHGSSVLRRKLTLLAAERDRLKRRRAQTVTDWTAADATARGRLERATLLDGLEAVEAAAEVPPAEVAVPWTAVMGVRCPGEPSVLMPQRLPQLPAPGGAALCEAEEAYRGAALAAVRHAAADAALAAVEAEMAATRRRVRALDRHWIPALEAALAARTLQLAELEAADLSRRRSGRLPASPEDSAPGREPP